MRTEIDSGVACLQSSAQRTPGRALLA